MNHFIKFRNSIAIPIILILLSLTTAILVAGYYINEQVFYNVFEEREKSKASNINLTIESLISSEVKRISSFAKVLKRDTDVAYALYHYKLSRGDRKPLKQVMDQLYAQMNLSVFIMADPAGKILYQTNKDPGEGKLESLGAFNKALKGEQVITAAGSPSGWGLLALVPIYTFDTQKPAGILILGRKINDDFAKKIARESGNQVFLATPEGLIAGSYQDRNPSALDLSLVRKCLSDKQPLFLADRRNFRSTTYVPLKMVDAEFCLVLETDISMVKDLLSKNKVKMAQWGGIIFFCVALVGGAMTFALIRPLNDLQEKARKVVREYSGDDSKAVPRGNEITTLVRAIHLMVETIRDHITESKRAAEALRQSEEHLRQAQKMEAIGKLAGGVAHDFNNLLSVITGYSELLLAKLRTGSPGLHEIEEIHKAGERAASLTHQLLAFSRRQVLMPKPLLLNESVASLEKMLKRLIGENIELVTNTDPDPWKVLADPIQIDQILINLAVNARDAMPGGGKLSISTFNREFHLPLVEGAMTLPAGPYACLDVTDTGCGMDRETLGRIFEPFFTTKEQGKGTGLGLATVYGIVKQSGGFIRVLSEPGRGTTFIVYFPRTLAAESAGEPTETERKGTHGNETVLLVEDEEMVRELVSETLRGFGYSVLEAPDGQEAVAVSEKYRGTIHLLITDVVMPGMNGLELARRLKSTRPDLLLLFMSGYSEEAVNELGVMGLGEVFLQKPITPSRLSEKVRELLSGGAAVSPA
ncbi:MAG: ATP-binding protein [Deltaproteobacteria bacterium]|nr:ATP-binding protein [Candidatus Deferrimicrobiaceae bacterium]